MVSTPIQFWALMICALGTSLALAALYAQGVDPETRTMAFTAANSLISGGLGAFATSHIATKYVVGPGNPTQGPQK